MDLTTVHTLYETLAESRWGFLYSGAFHDEHSARLIDLAEDATKGPDSADGPFHKKLGFVLVEAYQNVIRHRSRLQGELHDGKGRSLFMVLSDGRDLDVATMNPLPSAESAELRNLLERIGGTDLKQLKEMFLRGLQGNNPSQKGGAGLGLIEIARRSNGGLRYELKPIDPSLTMFTMQLRIGASAAGRPTIAFVERAQQLIGALDAVIVFKGALSSGVEASIMKMIMTDLEKNRRPDDPLMGTYLAAIETISDLGQKKDEPILVLAKAEKGHSVAIGMVMDNEAADRAQQQVMHMVEIGTTAAQRLYRDALLGRSKNTDLPPTGLLDLARRATSPLRTERHAHDERTLLLIEATVRS